MLLPAFLTRRFTQTLKGRTLARVATVLFVFLCFVGPIAAQFFLGIRDETIFEHPGYPIWPMIQLDRGPSGDGETAILIVFTIAVGLMVLSIPRMVRSVSEVLTATDERQSRVHAKEEASVAQAHA